jgi:hypothetical protein
MMISMPDAFILSFSFGNTMLDACLPPHICSTTAPHSVSASLAKAMITSTNFMASSGVGFMQFFPSGLRFHSPRKLQNMMTEPIV